MRLYNEQIAAISVFGAYKAKNKDAYDVIADFTKSAIAIRKEVQITPEVIQGFLRELYALDIPIWLQFVRYIVSFPSMILCYCVFR